MIFCIPAVVLLVILLLAMRKVECPQCHTPLPPFRLPERWQQALFGGWTCPHCQTEIDRCGQAIQTLRDESSETVRS